MPDTHPIAASIAVQDAERRLHELVERAERGEDIELTRDGRAVARLTRAKQVHQPQAALAAVDRIMKLREQIAREAKAPFTIAEMLRLRDEGRRH